MASRKTEFWLTTAFTEEGVKSAIVFAKSVRRTKTTRSVGVIASRTMPVPNRVALRKAFDAVFYMDEMNEIVGDLNNPPITKVHEIQEARAQFFAFSLHFVERLVYVGPNSMLLENMDKLFETTLDFQCLRHEDGSADFSLFMVKPTKGMWDALCRFRYASKLSNDSKTWTVFLDTWLSNQMGVLAMGSIKQEDMAKLSMKDGIALTDETHTPIIQLVDLGDSAIKEQVGAVTKELGRREKQIAEKWLDSYHKNAVPLLDSTANTGIDYEREQIFRTEPIAIIGMSCRYPKANNINEFWNLLYKGEEGIGEPPAFRWTKEHSIRVSQTERKTNAGFLSTPVDEFDSKFFGVSPKEAAYMDPQARLLHEVMWEALEDGGIDPLSLYGTHTGIFTGSWMHDYKDIVSSSTEKDFFRTYMGNSIGATTARLSFLLGVTGPSIATESGCSSAIVALDLAVKSLRSGESNMALAGGVNLLLHPFTSNIMDPIIAPNGRCKTFDSNADGFGRAEGCGVLVLKRLSDALRDRDNVWAMITGSAVSQEGLSRSLGTPTVHCEALAMQLALRDANITPEQVSFVETHGTGTAVGDPMEVAAIQKAYFSRNRSTPLVIGSVKTNVGHTESCSGITGIMKTVLALQHELIPKHLNLETLNPEIFLDSIPAMIPLEPYPWPKVKGQPRIAGVSSFGITGTDGHVIIQEAPDYEMPKFDLQMERPLHLLKISAKTSDALDTLINNYENQFAETGNSEKSKDIKFADTAYSANIGRASFNHRAFIVAKDHSAAHQLLHEKQFFQGEIQDGEQRKICFLFTGQGSQYHGMAKTLYETSPVFRIHFDACDRTLRKMYNLSIRQVLWENGSSSKEIGRTIYSQTSIFCVEYCLLKLWKSWGIEPDYVLGHSLGEFAAAVAAGILEFKDALKLVAERSRLIDSLPRGSMLVVKANEQEVQGMLKAAQIDLDLAAVNNPEQTVVAGNTDKIQGFHAYLKGQGHKSSLLDATHAFHSRHMEPMLEKYRMIASTIQYHTTSNAQYVSGMEGRILPDSAQIDADYWVRHTREKVSFVDACSALQGCTEFLEIGPQPVLSSFVMLNNDGIALNCLPSLRRGADDWNTILTSLGKLYLLGHKVDWKGYDAPYKRKKVSLPFHPFNRKSFWVDSLGSNATSIHPLLGCHMNNASAVNIFQNDIILRSLPYLKDHCIGPRVVFPGAGFMEMSLTAGYCVSNGITDKLEMPRRPIMLEGIRIEAPLELKEDKPCRMQVLVDLQTSGDSESQGFKVKVFHQNNKLEDSGKWVLHATSVYNPAVTTKSIMGRWNPEKIEYIVKTGKTETTDEFYKTVDGTGFKFGETFRSIVKVWRKPDRHQSIKIDKVVAEVRLPPDFSKYLLHPLLVDAIFQACLLTQLPYENAKLKVPVRVGKLILLNNLDSRIQHESLLIHAWLENNRLCTFICTYDHTPIAFAEDVELLDTNLQTIESVLEQQSRKAADVWEEMWKMVPSPFKNAINLVAISESLTEEERQQLRSFRKVSVESAHSYSITRKLIMRYIIHALYELGWRPSPGAHIEVESFCKEYKIVSQFHQLVRFYFTVLEQDEGLLLKDPCKDNWSVSLSFPSMATNSSEIMPLHDELEKLGIYKCTMLLRNLANNLVKILTGVESALSVLFPTEEDRHNLSAEFMYHNHHARPTCNKLLAINLNASIDICRKQNGNNKVVRILEVGAGTGAMTTFVLPSLKEQWGDQFEYYYTDISASFFIKAEKRLEEYRDNLKFAVFNIEESPLSQSIPVDYFDVVLATDVLHATRNLEESLMNLRETLRIGGSIRFTETIVESRDITFVFGTLEGYWRFEDFECRPHHTCVSVDKWEMLLKKTGYSQFSSFVFEEEFALIVAEKTIEQPMTTLKWTPRSMNKTWIVFGNPSAFSTLIPVVRRLQINGYEVVLVENRSHPAVSQIENGLNLRFIQGDDVNPSEINELLGLTSTNTECSVEGIIYAWGLDENDIDQNNISLPFLNIAKAISTVQKPPMLHVVTRGLRNVKDDAFSSNPTAATLFGMAKSLKNELWSVFVRCIDLDVSSSPSEDVEQLLYEIAMCRGSKEQNRLQVAYRDTIRYEPRLILSTSLGNELQLPPSTDRYKLVLPKSKMIQDLEFDICEAESIETSQVEIKVKAFSLNFKDILSILKPTEEFEKLNTIGLDFSGVVTKAGPMAKVKVGTRVFGANFNEVQLPSHLVLDSEAIIPIPEHMSFWEAATLPAVFATAYHCLITVADMKKTDTVLIHTASGGVGLAAIQLAKHVGSKIITTAGSNRKKTYLRSIGIQHVFHSRDPSFERDILSVTNGRGVDIVLNSITGPGIKEATLNCCAPNARFVEMSKLSIWTPDEVGAFRPDVQYSIEDLTVLSKESWKHLLQQLKTFIDLRRVSPIPYVKFDALHIRQALHFFQKAKHIGKVISVMPDVVRQDGRFEVTVPLFNSESTYLITGGLGGIGLEVCKWMVRNGANDVVLTGRNPPKLNVSSEIQALIDKGHNIMVKLADVSNYEQCKSVVDWITNQMKPLRGVMHCAGVLADNLFTNQTWSAFQATFSPKVLGTWNLHHLTNNLLLEHFVVFSSVCALVGTPGQSNHTAANCFEDAFIHFRHSLGLPGTSINWGQWAEVGVAKEAQITGLLPVSVQRMLNALEEIFKAQKTQACVSEFSSFKSANILCPTIAYYVDERLWNQESHESTTSSNALNSDDLWKELEAKDTKAEKTEVISCYLKCIIRQALRLDPEEKIGDDINLQDIGVDSLMTIELKNNIQTLLGSRVLITAADLKNCNTVRLLAGVIVDKILDEDASNDDGIAVEPLPTEDLRALVAHDSVLPDDIILSQPAISPSQITCVLITGVTGKLAPYIVSQLIHNYPAVQRIICLVRNVSDSSSALEKVRANFESLKLWSGMEKLECVAGNVALQRLGLNEDNYKQLTQDVHAIVHCAASNSYREHYRRFPEGKVNNARSINVVGTLNILRFACLATTKHVYFASNFPCGLFGESEKNCLSDNWPNNDAVDWISARVLPAVQASKVICEVLLRQAVEKGIPCKVFRFPWIAGESRSGLINPVNNLYINRYLSFIKMKSMTMLPLPANVLPVDICACISLRVFFLNNAPNDVYNIGHPSPPVEQQFVTVAKELFDVDLEVVDWQEFKNRIIESDDVNVKELCESQESMYLYMSDAVGMVKGYFISPDTFFVNEKLSSLVPNYDKEFPSAMDVLRKDLSFLKESRLLEKYGM